MRCFFIPHLFWVNPKITFIRLLYLPNEAKGVPSAHQTSDYLFIYSFGLSITSVTSVTSFQSGLSVETVVDGWFSFDLIYPFFLTSTPASCLASKVNAYFYTVSLVIYSDLPFVYKSNLDANSI